MNEAFEHRSLIDRTLLRTFQQRQDWPSILRLTLHLSAFLLCAYGVLLVTPHSHLAAGLLSVVLGGIWGSLFAPFHECTHQTAFKSVWLNSLGAWLSGFPFGMAPAVYRAFHFDHHRYTQYADKDPELLFLGGQPVSWPTRWKNWLLMISGWGLIQFKTGALVRLPLLAYEKWEAFAPWAPLDQRPTLAWQSGVIALFWVGLIVAACIGPAGMGWVLFAGFLSHTFQAIWVTTEHTGLPNEGSILARTRTMQTWPFFSWWLWNMNFHAEHHAWPAVPWYRLPALHREVSEHLDATERGYARLQFKVWSKVGV